MRIVSRLKPLVIALALAFLSFLFGCRAFQPEVIIVNHPPETYIIAAPMEESGGKFNFHVYWYGTDDDGRVVNYVWALTDSSIQDDETDEDEEDANFNPALNITTLEIGHWTTRNDSIFDFQINDGFNMSRNMTFHIVAQDDRGDFDRTPARLRFLSNALGGPMIEFYNSTEQNDETRITGMDTIGYGAPFEFTWKGGTANTIDYPPDLLAVRDTVPPRTDGLFGFKYKLPLDVQCDDSINDCWNPTRFDFAEGGKVSYYADISHLTFSNDSDNDPDVHKRRLSNGVHQLFVTTIDIAGVELRPADQLLSFVINHDPDTWILRGEDTGGRVRDNEEPKELDYDPFNPTQERVYPYYYLYDLDGNYHSYTEFNEYEMLPNRAIAVFKAMGKDHEDDIRFVDIDPALDPGFKLMFQGKFEAWGHFRGSETSLYPINTEWSLLKESIWDDTSLPDSLSADTLSFNVGPFDYRFQMRSVDEHLRRDGTPETFEFTGNYPPEAHAVTVGTFVSDARDVGEYYNDFADTGVDTLYLSNLDIGVPDPVAALHPDWIDIRAATTNADAAWIKASTGTVVYEEPLNTDGYLKLTGTLYDYELRLFGQDYEKERLFTPAADATETPIGNRGERMMSWFYGITSDLDVDGRVRDGNGLDNEYFGGPDGNSSLASVSYEFENDNSTYPSIDPNGVWHLKVKVFVPDVMQKAGVMALRGILGAALSPGLVDEGVRLFTVQLGGTNASIVARDATSPEYNSEHCRYVYYTNTRVLEGHGDSCVLEYPGSEKDIIHYEDYFKVSDILTKRYVIVARAGGSTYPEY